WGGLGLRDGPPPATHHRQPAAQDRGEVQSAPPAEQHDHDGDGDAQNPIVATRPPGARQHRGHHGQQRQRDSAAAAGRYRTAHGVVSSRLRAVTAAIAATAATINASAAVPAKATLRGVVSLAAGPGGTATAFAGVPPGPTTVGSLPAGSCQVRAASGSTLP